MKKVLFTLMCVLGLAGTETERGKDGKGLSHLLLSYGHHESCGGKDGEGRRRRPV